MQMVCFCGYSHWSGKGCRVLKRLLLLILTVMLLPVCVALGEETAEPSATPFATLSYGAQGEDVSAIQERLKELGYYTGKVSGNYLDGTQSAIKTFQKEYGLEQTGQVDAETYDQLSSAEYRDLSNGDDGDDVTRLQERLKELGYFTRSATGKYRSITANAIKRFQKQNGLESTGTADIETQRVLFGENALADGASPTPTPNPDEDLGDVNDMVLAGDGEAVVEEYEKQLTRGAKGENVKKVQTRLKELGFFDGPISGNYMNQTVAAVKAFQLHNGMEETGKTDETTWNLMFNDSSVVDASATPKPTPVPTPIPYAVTVDVRNQAVIVYGRDDNGEYTVPVKRMVCSTGLKATPSDVGQWTLNGKTARWCYFSKWGSHAQYWTRINENIAFHSVIYNQVDYNALSVKSYNKLGQRASHGCVRLLVSDAKWIYDNIGKGVVVTITEDLPSDEELRKSVAAPALNKSKTGPVTTPEPTPEPEYLSDGMPPQPFRKLKKGSSGEDVYWLQMKLTELGYYTGTVTGGYYSGTEKAVKAYQKANKISATGTADERTLESIYADVLAANTPTPEPTVSPTPAAE